MEPFTDGPQSKKSLYVQDCKSSHLTLCRWCTILLGPTLQKALISGKKSHHVNILTGASVRTLVYQWIGHSPWFYPDISYAVKVRYWSTSMVSKTMKFLPVNVNIRLVSNCYAPPCVLIHPCACWWICKILCECIQIKACWTLIDLLSVGQNNDTSDISSISWHHCMSLTRELWGHLKKLKAQSGLTFRSADFPHLEGIRPANLKRPWTWTGGSLIRKTSDH